MARRSWILLAATAALWGASYLFIKVALEELPEGAIVFVRVLLGAAVLVPLAAHAGALRATRGRWGWLAVITLIQVVAPFLLIVYGENHVPSALAGILVSSAPIFTALLAARFDHSERLRGWSAVGIVLGIVGVVLLFGADLSGSGDAVVGGLMILLASLCYAIGSMLIKHRAGGIPPVAIAASNMALASLVTLPLVVADPPSETPSLETVGSLVALGAGGTGVAFLWYYLLLAELGPGRASVIAYVAPAFSVVYGALLLDEAVTAGTVGGLGLILAGSYLAVAGGRRVSRSGPSRSTEPAPVRAR